MGMETMTVDELRAEAKKLGLKGYSKAKKADLIDMICAATTTEPVTVEAVETPIEAPGCQMAAGAVSTPPRPIITDERLKLAAKKLVKAKKIRDRLATGKLKNGYGWAKRLEEAAYRLMLDYKASMTDGELAA